MDEKKINPWNVVNEAIARSKIFRIKWKGVLGESLTRHTLKLKNEGYTAKEIIQKILDYPGVYETLLSETDRETIEKNLKISVCSVYSSANIMEEVKDG